MRCQVIGFRDQGFLLRRTGQNKPGMTIHKDLPSKQLSENNFFPNTYHLTPITYEKGNILVTALLILLVMNLLGIGIASLATKEWSVANYKSIDSEVFHTAEGCPKDVIIWFGTQTSTPSTIANFSATTTSLLTASQSANSDINHKLTGYSYNCSVTYITRKETTSSRTSGAEIGNSGGSYNLSGNQVLKDYYQITSTGSGPKNSSKVTNTVISVEY